MVRMDSALLSLLGAFLLIGPFFIKHAVQ